MAISLPDGRELSDEVLECLRLRALHACELGCTEQQAADILGVGRETVSRWWSAYTTGGVDALPHERSGRPVGSGRTLSDEQAQHLRAMIDGHHPEDWGIAAPLWTRRAVRDLIRNEFGIAMPMRTVGAYLRRWGYTSKRPRRKARHQDPDEVQEWMEHIYPAIVEVAERENGDIQWCDEKGVAGNDYPGCGYAPVGQKVELVVSSHPCHMNQVVTISNEGKVRFMTYKGMMTGTLFVDFLTRLVRGAQRKIFLIVDRLPAHEAEVVERWLQGREQQIEMVFLPAGAPEINPVEYLNNDEKAEVNAAKLPSTTKELRSNMQRFLHRLVHLPERVMSFFLHPCLSYVFEPV